MEIFKGGGEGMEAALFQKTLHAQLNTCGIQHVLALVTVDLCRRCQAIAAFVLVHQRVNVAIADVIHHLHQSPTAQVLTEKPNLICAATLSPSVTATSRMLSPKRTTFRWRVSCLDTA